jgi:hypothetical protein
LGKASALAVALHVDNTVAVTLKLVVVVLGAAFALTANKAAIEAARSTLRIVKLSFKRTNVDLPSKLLSGKTP